MFAEIKTLKNDENKVSATFAFLKSLDVTTFPSGRRRSELVDFDGEDPNNVKDYEKYHIPYDPEAKLNTEFNNIRQTSINGLGQTFIHKWDFDHLMLSIGGYLFNLTTRYEAQSQLNYNSIYDAFGKTYEKDTKDTTGSVLYANIRIESVPLYSGFEDYYTQILRDQTDSATPSTALDILQGNITADNAEGLKTNPKDCFYFAGLSFSTIPMAIYDVWGNAEEFKVDADTIATWKTEETYDSYTDDGRFYQRVLSLKILEKDADGHWVLHQPALLPNIKHGDTEDSVKVATLYADNMQIGDSAVPALQLVQIAPGSDTYRLTFTAASMIPAETSE